MFLYVHHQPADFECHPCDAWQGADRFNVAGNVDDESGEKNPKSVFYCGFKYEIYMIASTNVAENNYLLLRYYGVMST